MWGAKRQGLGDEVRGDLLGVGEKKKRFWEGSEVKRKKNWMEGVIRRVYQRTCCLALCHHSKNPILECIYSGVFHTLCQFKEK